MLRVINSEAFQLCIGRDEMGKIATISEVQAVSLQFTPWKVQGFEVSWLETIGYAS
jgi:hypothetical protein